MLALGVQQSDSIIYKYIYVFSIFHDWLLQATKYSSLCYYEEYGINRYTLLYIKWIDPLFWQEPLTSPQSVYNWGLRNPLLQRVNLKSSQGPTFWESYSPLPGDRTHEIRGRLPGPKASPSCLAPGTGATPSRVAPSSPSQAGQGTKR